MFNKIIIYICELSRMTFVAFRAGNGFEKA